MKTLFCRLRGLVIAVLLVLNALVLPSIVLVIGAISVLLPLKRWYYFCERINQVILPPIWVKINKAILRLNTSLQWDIEEEGDSSLGGKALSKNNWYFLISNHRSYADILIIDYVFSGKTPKIKFFMKRQLLWLLPVVGLACRVMGYPFLYRATKRQIKKNPALKGKDKEAIKKACQACTRHPTALLNFLEGTRFTAEKHAKAGSPYKHLLPPNMLGFALPINVLAELEPKIINVTLVYPGHANPSLWQFISGQIKRVIVRYEVLPFAPQLQGDVLGDRALRQSFRQFINQLWKEKDALIELLSR